MLENITFAQITWLNKQGLNLSHLKYLEEMNGIDDKYSRHLEKVGMLFNGAITQHGQNILEQIKQVKEETIKAKVSKVKAEDKDFQLWLSNFPLSANFKHKGQAFKSVRRLHSKLDECQTKFRKILDEGKYNVQQLIDALVYEVNLRKDQSINRNRNELEFMRGTISYLNSQQYLIFIDKQTQPKRNNFNVTI